MIPALLTKISSCPKVRTVVEIVSMACEGSFTSPDMQCVRSFGPIIDCVSLSADSSRPVRTTLAPAEARAIAAARPMPREAPVTIAALPSKENSDSRNDIEQKYDTRTMNRYFLALCLLVFVATRAIAIRPDTHYVSSPDQNGLAYDSLNIVTPDHYRLTAWYCKVSEPSSKTLIVLAGGDAGNMSYDLALAQFLIENFKVPVLLFDYRGF